MSATQKVDVLAYHALGMRNAAEAGGIKLTKAGCENLAYELELVHAAVLELVSADRDFDTERSAFELVFRPETHTRQAVSPKHNDPVLLAYHAASKRRAIALAIVLAHIGCDV